MRAHVRWVENLEEMDKLDYYNRNRQCNYTRLVRLTLIRFVEMTIVNVVVFSRDIEGR